ncbi:MAG: helix-hairpin-helix domain-containing protein [Proteobacteria bacterium]|nr:helix-hairpin-helix domain-containing protein [Pseudomonadota bacterium]
MFKRSLAVLALCLAIALPAVAATPVNVNKADAQTIATSLDGIGMSKAQAIVAYRDAHGPFKQVEELRHVKGIGEKTLARNHDAIRLDGAVPAAAPKAAAKPSHRARKQ